MSGSIKQEEKEPANDHWEYYRKKYIPRHEKPQQSKISTSKLGGGYLFFKNSPSLSMQLLGCGEWTYSK